MKRNADFSKRVLVRAEEMEWAASPMPGVERRMLDRIGDEVARATSIVRYAPGSAFNAHTHGGGEEFLVLEGTFQDGDGDYPAGYYVRNPPGSRHTPGSVDGCVIFVKLWQFDAADSAFARIDTKSARYAPVPGASGLTRLALFADAIETVCMEQWAPEVTTMLGDDGGLELLVVSGTCTLDGEVAGAQTWLRLPPGDQVRAVAGSVGCRVWIKRGHLHPETLRVPASA